MPGEVKAIYVKNSISIFSPYFSWRRSPDVLVSSPLLCCSLQIVQNGMIRHTTAGTGLRRAGRPGWGLGLGPGPPAQYPALLPAPGWGQPGTPPSPQFNVLQTFAADIYYNRGNKATVFSHSYRIVFV